MFERRTLYMGHHIIIKVKDQSRLWLIKAFDWFQITNFVSSALIGNGNATVSTLTYSPRPDDHGKILACQAHVKGLPGSIVEDSKRLYIHCKLLFVFWLNKRSRGRIAISSINICVYNEFNEGDIWGTTRRHILHPTYYATRRRVAISKTM